MFLYDGTYLVCVNSAGLGEYSAAITFVTTTKIEDDTIVDNNSSIVCTGNIFHSRRSRYIS